jgi:hypothetical protein
VSSEAMKFAGEWCDRLLDAADDLDRLEELEPRPGRVGAANDLRLLARSWRMRSDFYVVPKPEEQQ